MKPPVNPKLYHIVHVDRLASIADGGFLFSDAELQARGGVAGTTIGMGNIKERRLRTELGCHPGLSVGQCVPFYFCPRSVMLFVIHRANHPDLAYRGGQRQIVHLECDLNAIVDWAEQEGLRWALTLSNAGSTFFESHNRLDRLDSVNWSAVAATDWSAGDTKEAKQAEFLVEKRIAWSLVDRIGVIDGGVGATALSNLGAASHRPPVVVERDWYY